MARKPPPDHGFGGVTAIRRPGVYEVVLQRVCKQEAHASALSRGRSPALIDLNDPERLVAEVERDTHLAALIETTRGATLYIQRWQLPGGEPPMPGHWRDEMLFTVTPDDVITLRPRPSQDRQPRWR